jgi:hypothetical protein
LPEVEGEIGLNAGLRPLWVAPGKRRLGHGRAKHFVDFQNDVTAATWPSPTARATATSST